MTKAQRNQEFEKHIKEVAGALRDEGVTFVLAAKTRDGGAVTYSNEENDMTIKALEQQPCEDTISRQAAIDALTRKMVSIPTAGEKDLMGDVNRIQAEDISVIRRLPPAQPETHEERTETHACD